MLFLYLWQHELSKSKISGIIKTIEFFGKMEILDRNWKFWTKRFGQKLGKKFWAKKIMVKKFLVKKILVEGNFSQEILV